MSNLMMGPVQLTRYIHDEAGLVEYRMRWTAEIDAVAAKAAARHGVDTEMLIARAIFEAVGLQPGPLAAEDETEH